MAIDDESDAPTRGTIILEETKDVDVPWYRAEPGPRYPPQVHHLFQTYVGLQEEQILPHIKTIHAKAWQIRPYPCIGQYIFLNCPLTHRPALYSTIQDRLQHENALMLDIGTCFGQELRQLAAHGAPTTSMYALDLVPDFWEMAYDLYRDRDRMHAHFFVADILAGDASEPLRALAGKVDIINAASLLHLFSWEKQVQSLTAMVRLSSGPGALVVGHNVGRSPAGVTENKWYKDNPPFLHDETSFCQIWEEVGNATGTKWEVEVLLGGNEIIGLEKGELAWMGPLARTLRFAVTRQV